MRERVVFINSDPHLIRFYLRFLAVAGVTADRLICRIHIHESADVTEAHKFWQAVTELPADQFGRPTLKRHNPKTTRKNTGDDYHGCVVIAVRRSTELYRQIEGWAAAAMARGPSSIPDPHGAPRLPAVPRSATLPGKDSNLHSPEPKSGVLPD